MITKATMVFPCGGTTVKEKGAGAGYFKAHKLKGRRPVTIHYEGYDFTDSDKEQIFKRSRHILHPKCCHVYLNGERLKIKDEKV